VPEDLYDCYLMLEVKPGASLEEVKSAYRELVKVWHPDRFSHDPKLRDKAADKLKKINLAYERICKAGAEPRPYSRQREQGDEGQNREQTYGHTQPPRPSARRRTRLNPSRIWTSLVHYGKPVAAVAVSLALIYVLYPESEPQLLIELPPEEPPVVTPAKGTTVRRANRPQARAFKLPDPKLFGVGSTKAEVIEAQGSPDRATDTLFVYGTSDVVFENDKVKSWRNGYPRLKVKMFAAPNLGGIEHFTVGSTKDQVVHAQGTPDSLTDTSFTYGTSKVYFENGKVKSWSVRSRALKVRLLPKDAVGQRTHFTLGSTKDEVLAAQGTPDAFTESEFSYGSSRVYFDKGRVQSWQSGSPKLNAKPPA